MLLDPFKSNEHGISLIELIIAISISIIILAGIFNAFIQQRKALKLQELIVEMQQNVRAAMDMMLTEIKLAGYDPNDLDFNGIVYSPDRLQIRADLNGDMKLDDAFENIIYYYDKTNLRIYRITGIYGIPQPFVENIASFNFYYYDANQNITTTSEDIRQIKIELTGRTSKPVPSNDKKEKYKYFTLSSYITPRNLGLQL